MLKVYGNAMSTCTRKVLMALNETQTPFELVTVNFATGEHKQESHVRKQPFGRIPAIDDDGFEMFESRAICRYINEKAKGHLVPTDIKAMAKMEQWISIETSEFTGNAMKFIYEFVFKRPQEPGVLDAAGKALGVVSNVMDKELARKPFLAGADFSIADICFMPYFEYAMGTPAKDVFAKYPHVMAWWQKVSERPTWKKTIAKA
ncbi:MAG TPA: glutathione binding-like protein [Polyangiaceae bacterium]|jgi:glutathione S-transferase